MVEDGSGASVGRAGGVRPRVDGARCVPERRHEDLIYRRSRPIIVSVQPNGWKLLLAVALIASIVLGVRCSAPRQAVPRGDLHRLVLSGLSLYAVGGLAALVHRQTLARLVFAAGIATCALAVWLARGTDSEDPPDDEELADEPPPPDPDGIPKLEWEQFECAFRDYAEREPAGSA